MAFKFSRKQKQLATKNVNSSLRNIYDLSEKRLEICAKKGSRKEMDKAMKLHQDVEYALLYQNTPEFKKRYFKNNFDELKQGSAVDFSKDFYGNVKAQNISIVDYKNSVGKVGYGIWGENDKTIDYYQKFPKRKVKQYKK